MKFSVFAIPVTLFTFLVIGCSFTVNDLPSTNAERYLYSEGYLEDPLNQCELGHQKIYYVVKHEHGDGGRTVLTMTNCLTAEHIANLNLLSTLPDQYSHSSKSNESELAKSQATTIIEKFRTPLPDLSAHGINAGSESKPATFISR